MRRLYYLADNLDTIDDVSVSLHREGINDWHFHVLSKDEAGLYKHHLHSATPLQRRDIIRGGERGALTGFFVGLLVAVVSLRMLELAPMHSVVVSAIAIALPTLFGAWAGGLVGLSLDNYKIARFRRDIEAGRALLMIDVDRVHYQRVLRLMSLFAVEPCGEDSTLITPFKLSHA